MDSQQDDAIESSMSTNEDCSHTFAVGDIVQVQARTWPGINKPGGIGRITQRHCSNDGVTDVDVQYVVVGGREKRVPIQYVKSAPPSIAASNPETMGQTQRNHLRDRSMLLGRCRLCGSLRMDCGSCDWIEQERLAEQARNQPQEGTGANLKQSDSNITRARKKRRRLAKSNMEELLSSSSSDEDLFRQIQAGQRQHRRYLRQKADWVRVMNESSHQSRRGEPKGDTESSASSDSDDDDPVLARLNELSNRRRQGRARFLQHKYSQPKQKHRERDRKRVLRTGPSSLESLKAPRMRAGDTTPTTKANTHSTAHRESTSPEKSPESQEQIHPLDDASLDDVEDVGDPDLSPTTHFPSPARSLSDTAGSIDMEDFQDELQDAYGEPNSSLDLDGARFIQPEGSLAAENLPRDIIDRTLSVPFKRLPSFFDDLVARLSNDIIPDAKIDLADFQRRSREARNGADPSSLRQLEEEGIRLFSRLQQNVIKDGVDQCCAAMRRIVDRRQYRRHRKDLNPTEKGQFGGVNLDVREMKLDELSQSAECFMKNASDVLLKTAAVCDGLEIGEGEVSESESESESDNSVVPSAILTQDLIGLGTDQLNTSCTLDGNDPLPPFDPHMHATTVKSRKPQKGGEHVALAGQSRRKRKKAARDKQSHTAGIASPPLFRSEARKLNRSHGPRKTASGIRQPDIDDTNMDDLDVTLDMGSKSAEVVNDTRKGTRKTARSRDASHVAYTDKCAADLEFSGERGRRYAPIADRMQAFLDANSSNADGYAGFIQPSTSNESDTIRARFKSHRVREHGSCSERPQRSDRLISGQFAKTGIEDSSSAAQEVSVEQDGEPIGISPDFSMDLIYRRLVTKLSVPPRADPAPEPPIAQLSDSCEALIKSYPESAGECALLFKGILHYFKSKPVLVHSDAVVVFTRVLKLLQLHGNMILQGVVLTDKDQLRVHVQLLVFTLNLVEHKVHSALAPSDGAVYDVFGAKRADAFVEMIVLQMVDAIYAQIRPSCWGLDRASSAGVVQALIPLRDALGRIVPLVETVSRCVLEILECQQWRELAESSKYFVSALNPSEYKSLLVSGKNPPLSSSPDSVRYLRFKTCVPRPEIDAIWFLLAFSAEAPTIDSDASVCRWRLIKSTFFSDAGVLSKEAVDATDKTAIQLPPSAQHLFCCRSEILRLTALLSSGALKPIPSSADGVVIKLIQKSIDLQAQECTHATQPAIPGTLPELDEKDITLLLSTWKKNPLHNVPMNDGILMEIEQNFNYDELRDGGHSPGSVAGLLSTSTMLEGCVSLLLAWIHQTPKKKARLLRLKQSVDKLIIRDFIDRANRQEESAVSLVASTFEEAFAPKPSKVGTSSAVSVYKEAAARLSIALACAGAFEIVEQVTHASANAAMLTKELRSAVWEIMANDQMMQTQKYVLNLITSKPDAYEGDMFRLFATAKALAWLSSLHFGVPSSDLIQGLPVNSLSQALISGLDDDSGMLVFLTSCMLSCLDCACDSFERTAICQSEDAFARAEDFSTLVSCLCWWLSSIFIRSRTTLKIAPTTPNSPSAILHRAAQELRTSVLCMTASPLKRCLACLTSLPIRCDTGDLALRSALGLLRLTVGLVSPSVNAGAGVTVVESSNAHNNESQIPVAAEKQEEEDYFGSIDDDLFLSIDMGISMEDRSDKDVVAFREIWDVLIDIVKLTKPSDQFAVLPPCGNMACISACMTIQGRALAASQVGVICACLAALVCLEKQDSERVNLTLDSLLIPSKSSEWSDQDDPDKSYLRRLAQCLYSEICSLSADFEHCDQLVRKRYDDVVESFIGAMLDSDTLERFPSINLKRIKINGGARSEWKESMRLSLANSPRPHLSAEGHDVVNEAGARLKKGEALDCPGPAYNSSSLWSFHENLGKAIARNECDHSTGNDIRSNGAFMELDSDLVAEPADMIPLVSLERECLKRITLFRTLLSNSARIGHADGVLRFERLSSLIVSSCAYQLVSISEGVRYHVHIGRNEGNGTKSYKHARLLELQSCYADLTMTLFSWILRESPHPRSDTCESLLQSVRDTLFSRVLLRQNCDIHAALIELYSIAVTASAKNDFGAGRTTAHYNPSGLLNDMSVALVCRSREVMLHLATEQQSAGMGNIYCLFNSLLTAAIGIRDPSPNSDQQTEDHTLELIANSMESDNREAIGVSFLEVDRSCFGEAVDEYMLHVERSRGLQSNELMSIQRLRRFAIRQFLVPKLVKGDFLTTNKKGVLRLMSHMLEKEVSIRSPERLDIPLIASITKGLAFCLRSALESHHVDDELVSKTFQCAMHVLRLPIPLTGDAQSDGDDADTVLSWSRDCKEECESARTPHALYFWTFATWLNDIGEMLVGRTDQHKKRFDLFRTKAVSLMAQEKSIWSRDSSDSSDVIINASLRLIDIEDKVFAEKENALPVANVYAKSTLSKTRPPCAPSEESSWTPSAFVCRAAKEVMAEVIAVL